VQTVHTTITDVRQRPAQATPDDIVTSSGSKKLSR